MTNNANDVIIRPNFGTGISLGNSKNITLKAITVDISLGNKFYWKGIREKGREVNITAACTADDEYLPF